MRAAFGLVALMVTVGIVLYIWAKYTSEVAKVNKQIQPQVAQISGHDEDGTRAMDTITLEPEETTNGKVKYVLVKGLLPGGIMERHYGLKVGDQIIKVGDQNFDLFDGGMAKAMVQESFQRSQTLLVRRGSQEILLPQTSSSSGGGASPGGSATPSGGGSGNKSSVQRQLDAITGPR